MASSKPIDYKLIEKLTDLLGKSDLSEIEIEQDDFRIRLSRTTATTVVSAPIAAPAPALSAVSPPGAIAPASQTPEPAATGADSLKSPMVGTAYLSSEPGAAAFVSVGDTVKKGQTVLIIEAMKTMNQIPADRDGTVSAILIDDAQPVEFGEPLIIIDQN